MKRIVLFVAIAFLVAAPKPIEKDGMVCRTKKDDNELKHWISGIQVQANKAIGEAKAAKESEKNVTVALVGAQEQGEKLSQERDQAIIDKDHVLKKLHRLKFSISALATALVIFVMLKLGIPPPLSFYIAGGSIVAVNVAIWTLL